MDKLILQKTAEKLGTFPFKSYLSFLPIIRFWETLASEGSEEEKTYAGSILAEVDKIPALRKPVKNHQAFVKRHRKTVDKLMSAVFPKALEFNEIKAVTPPFVFDIITASPRFQKIVDDNGGCLGQPCNIDASLINYAKFVHVCLAILAKYYHRLFPLETPFVFCMTDPETGLDLYYKMTLNADFVEINARGKLKELSDDEIDNMLENIKDVTLWQKHLPPENFEISGFVVCNLVNVTLNEVLSQLKHNLLERDALLTEKQFKKIRRNVRSLFKVPDLKVGLGLFNETEGISNFGHWGWRDLICKGQIDNVAEEFKGSIYHKVLETGEAVIVENIEKIKNPTGIELAIREAGTRSLILAPIKNKERTIGFLELGSGHPKVLSSASMTRVHDILPLFSVGIQRSIEERENRIDAIIMEKFTAIHSSVQWRFQEAAENYLRSMEKGSSEIEIEPIVFNDVYPMYGMADIRDSSVHRNLSIQADLTRQLELAQKIILKVKAFEKFPILEEINFRIEKLISSIGQGLRSQDENRVHRILGQEVEPFFEYIITEDPSVAIHIDRYRKALDPRLGVVYNRRKLYEQSVTKINTTISDFLEAKEKEAQKMFPHYFEKYKTDGLDYNIYVGESILRNGSFNKMCLSNIRLWQLMMMAEMTQISRNLEPKLPIPLSTAQLILVHDEPMSIRFRVDEKKFDVDGAYNMRYEIIKKRIDKALIKGTNERATQPGTVTIVYTNPEVFKEYQKYCEFLEHKNLIEEGIEQLSLEDTQGVTGLKALRVRVRTGHTETVSTSEIEEIISSLQE